MRRALLASRDAQRKANIASMAHMQAVALQTQAIQAHRKRREERLFKLAIAYKPAITKAGMDAVGALDERREHVLFPASETKPYTSPPTEGCDGYALYEHTKRVAPLRRAHTKLRKEGLFAALAVITNESDLHLLLRAFQDAHTKGTSACTLCGKLGERFEYRVYPEYPTDGVKHEWQLCKEVCADAELTRDSVRDS